MPIPKPGSNESEKDFMSRCMGDDVMRREFPDQSQRAAVCHRQLEADVDTTALQTHKAKIVDITPLGNGIVQFPILGVIEELDVSKTAGGGKGTRSIALGDLEQMVANFDIWPGPVPIGTTPHVEEFSDRAGASPGFIDKLFIKSEWLWAQATLVPWLFDEVVTGMWRGFSVEMAKDFAMPTAEFAGWVITGGIFTNRPATDVEFRIAAEGEPFGKGVECLTVSLSLRPGKKAEKGMQKMDKPEKSATPPAAKDDEQSVSLEFYTSKVTTLDAEIATKNSTIASLEARAEKLQGEMTTMRRSLTEAETKLASAEDDKITAESTANRLQVENKRLGEAKRTLETSLTETSEKLRKERTFNTDAKVRAIVEGAIDKGVPPAIFDGFEANPTEWVEGRYKDVEAFEVTVASFHGIAPAPGSKTTPSGHNPKLEQKTEEKESEVDDETKEHLKKLDLGVTFKGATDEKTAHERWLAAQKNKEKN